MEIFLNHKNIVNFENSHFVLQKLALGNKRLSATEIRHKTKNLLSTIRTIANSTIQCVQNKDPKFTPTKFGLTKFAHYSEQEFASKFLLPMGRKKGEQLSDWLEILSDYSQLNIETTKVKPLPKVFDYRDMRVVNHPKDQGECGACFVFGATAAAESSYMLKYNKTGISFSEKAIFDCMWKDKIYNAKNCQEGGQVEEALEAAKRYGFVAQKLGGKYLIDGKSSSDNFNVSNGWR